MTNNLEIKGKFLFSFKMYLFNLLGSIIIATIGVFIFGNLNNNKTIRYDKQLMSVFGSLILAPILEELIFRLVLKDTSKLKNIVISTLSFFTALLFSNYKNNGLDARYFVVLIWIILIWCCNIFNIKKYIINGKNFTSALILISTLLFSISHYQNYEINNGNYSYIISFMALFLSGILLVKVRFKLGVVWSIFTHFLFNLIPSLIILFEHFKNKL